MKRKLSMLLVISLILTTAPTVQADAKKKAVTKEEIISYTIEIGGAYNICPELIQAVIETESTYKPDATNGDCIGLMQVCRKYNADRMEKLGVTDLYDPYSNILVGTDYLAELIQISIDKGYGDDLYYILMRYNMKTSTANRKYEACDYSEYATGVCELSAELEREHGR